LRVQTGTEQRDRRHPPQLTHPHTHTHPPPPTSTHPPNKSSRLTAEPIRCVCVCVYVCVRVCERSSENAAIKRYSNSAVNGWVATRRVLRQGMETAVACFSEACAWRGGGGRDINIYPTHRICRVLCCAYISRTVVVVVLYGRQWGKETCVCVWYTFIHSGKDFPSRASLVLIKVP